MDDSHVVRGRARMRAHTHIHIPFLTHTHSHSSQMCHPPYTRRAVAGESGVAFISSSASEFIEMYMGLGAARVRDVFNTVRVLCTVYIVCHLYDCMRGWCGCAVIGCQIYELASQACTHGIQQENCRPLYGGHLCLPLRGLCITTFFSATLRYTWRN